MSSFSTRWSVAQHHDVTPDDLGPDGAITDQAVERWAALARDEYLDQCRILAETRSRLALELRCETDTGRGARFDVPAIQVVVTATATEVFPTSFVIASRLRAVRADVDPVNVTCVVRLEDPKTGEAHPIDDDMRNELIALEHAARHFN